VMGFDAADPARVSAHALLRAEVSSERSAGSKQTRINQGYSALIQWLESRVRRQGGVIHTGATARLVKWKHGQVEVLFERGQQRERITANAALITLPLGVLKTNEVKFEPSLPRKMEAIANLPFGNVRKLALVFREVWWP